MLLPVLKGTIKQIPWATKIRADRLSVWEKSNPEKFKEVFPELIKQTYAGTWIADKDKGLEEVLGSGVAAGKAKVSRPQTSKPKDPPVSLSDKAYGALDGDITRYVGELRDSATGELVVDTDCPF